MTGKVGLLLTVDPELLADLVELADGQPLEKLVADLVADALGPREDDDQLESEEEEG